MSPPTPIAGAATVPAWWRELRHRILRLLWLKVPSVSAFMWLFFIGYFHTLRHPTRPPMQMPLTALDAAIPFQPAMFWAYVSLWVYVGIAPGLLLTLRELIVYGLWVGALSAAGLLAFHLWPTAVPRAELPVDVAQHPGFAVLQGVDAAGNACPSLHVAAALFTAIWIDRLLRDLRAPLALRVASGVWLLLIVWSTVAIRQHVVLDVVGGTLLALPFAWASLRWFPRSATWPAGGAR